MNQPDKKAIFLDRDGVIVEEVHLLSKPEDIRIAKDVPAALCHLKQAGYKLIVVTNQTVVSRGLITETELTQLNQEIARRLVQAGGPELDAWFVCPHHPKATVEDYRKDCDCRKPKPGMLLQAAREHALELEASFMVGDRLTDIIAGSAAGCRTVLVKTGAHEEPLIQTSVPIDKNVRPDHECANLTEAADWILKSK